MLKSQHWSQHSLYQKYLLKSLNSLYPTYKDRILEYSDLINKLFHLNLDPALQVLSPFYSKTGRPARYQAEILRSLVAMASLRIHSITNWVKKLRSDKVLAVICGFDPNHIPGIGTFYDFLNRFSKPNTQPNNLKKPTQKPKAKLNRGEKLPPKHPNIVKSLTNRVLKGKSFWDFNKTLSTLLSKIVVEPSISMDLIKNELQIYGDGTPIQSPANPYGKRVCNCYKEGIKHCNCKRKFSDPYATWGWDSYHVRYFFGYSLYVISTSNYTYDLPIHFVLAQANRHDSVLAIVALAQVKSLYPNLNFSSFISDSACDNMATYELCSSYGMNPIIDLNLKNTPKNVESNFNINGVPICPLGLPMAHWGYNKKRHRIKWRCPVAASKKIKQLLDICPIKDTCSKSSYGRVVYTYPKTNPRLFTNPPRGSKLWKKIYSNGRSSAERVIKRFLVDYQLERARVYSKKYWYWRIALIGINIYLDTWLEYKKLDIVGRLTSWAEEAA